MKWAGLRLPTVTVALPLAGRVAFLGTERPAEAVFPGKNGLVAYCLKGTGVQTVRPHGSDFQSRTGSLGEVCGASLSSDDTCWANTPGQG